ncbi:MAG: sigma-70 family RNA polymerase sigma factor [Thermoleophilaceae bacterium]
MTPRALLAPGRLAGQSLLRTQTDERLLDLAAAGSEAAFEAIVARYRRPLMGYLQRLLADERAEDALQQTFVKALSAIERGEQVRSLRAWLYRIAHNTAANLIRDNALPHEPLDDRLDGGDRPDLAADRRQALRDVLSAVQALPLRQRDAIVLRELEGRSYEEIADELGVTHGAVRALLNRARNTIRSSVTAVTPAGLVIRLVGALPDGSVPVGVAGICTAGAGGAALSKLCATALVTGAATGGVAAVPHAHHHAAARASTRPAVATAATQPRVAPVRVASIPAAASVHRRGRSQSAAPRKESAARERQPGDEPAPRPRPDDQPSGDRYATLSSEPGPAPADHPSQSQEPSGQGPTGPTSSPSLTRSFPGS